MNIISNIKNLTLISSVALALALSPSLSMAENGKHGKSKSQYTQERGGMYNKVRSQKYSHERHSNKHTSHSISKHRHEKHGIKHRPAVHHAQSHRKYGHHKRGYHGHNHTYAGHTHSNHVSHGHRGQFVDLDNMRFMFGLHTGNLDIIFRD